MRKWIPMIVSALLLTGCGAGEAEAPTYQQISMSEAVERMAQESGYILLDVRTVEEFREGAKQFILRLREIYGQKPVILWFDSETSNTKRNAQFDAMQALQKELGDENFFVAQFAHGFDGAGPATSQSGLPSAQNQRDLADQITAFLKENTDIGK